MDHFWDYVHRGVVHCGSAASLAEAVEDAERNLRLSGHTSDAQKVHAGRVYVVEGGSEIEVARLTRDGDTLNWVGVDGAPLPKED